MNLAMQTFEPFIAVLQHTVVTAAFNIVKKIDQRPFRLCVIAPSRV